MASYITGRAAQLSLTCRRNPITPLRGFLLYRTGEGLLPASLEYAIPRIWQWKHATLPSGLSEEDLAKALEAPCDGTSKIFETAPSFCCWLASDCAPGEILHLCLEDIDWRISHLLGGFVPSSKAALGDGLRQTM